MSGVLIVFVAIYPFQQNGFSVDQQLTILDFHFTESHPAPNHLHQVFILVLNVKGHNVKIGRFSTPFCRILNGGFKDNRGIAFPEFYILFSFVQQVLLFVTKHDLQVISIVFLFREITGNISSHLQDPVPVMIIQCSKCKKIADMQVGCGKEINIPFDAADPPEILAFQV